MVLNNEKLRIYKVIVETIFHLKYLIVHQLVENRLTSYITHMETCEKWKILLTYKNVIQRRTILWKSLKSK